MKTEFVVLIVLTIVGVVWFAASLIKSFSYKGSGYDEYNLNCEVKVKLTELGYQRLADINNEYVGKVKGFVAVDAAYFKNKADADGFTKFIFWEFMKDFGDVICFGGPEYFGTRILVKTDDLAPYAQPARHPNSCFCPDCTI